MTLPGQCLHELFDIVDEHDQVIGQAERGIVHAAGLRHRAAHVLVFNSAGELLVQRRALGKDSAPGCWDTSAAGHLDAGEDYAAAALRELSEELGVAPLAPPRRLFRLSAQPATGQEFINVFRCSIDAEPVPAENEIMALRWCGREALLAWIRTAPEAFTTSFRLIVASLADADWQA